jgi:hypothetical protein
MLKIQISSNPNLNNLILISWNSIPTQLLNLSNPLFLSEMTAILFRGN